MINYLFVIVASLAVVTPAAYAADDIVIERLFGPEIPGKYKHPPSITELDNGDLYVVYYGGEGDVIEGRYRILRISADSVDLAYVDGRGRRTISLTGGQ